MACLDTTVLIDLMGHGGRRRRDAVEHAIREHVGSSVPLFTTRFNFAELLAGVEGADDPIAERREVDAILSGVAILEFDELASLHFGKIRHYLRALGKVPGDMDLLIASVSLANAQPLITRNPKHFTDIPGLVVISY